MKIRDTTGRLLHTQPWILEQGGFPFGMGQRSAYQDILVQFTQSLGVKIHMNSRVEQHFETETGAGIVVNGVTHHADVVIGADGIHGRRRVHVTGSEEKVQSSGYAVFRAWFNLDEVEDPLFNELR
jgi:2-polyprenyl-6-methoxyphenol hydroxylase-like FAD-dependent oxidoreductase